MRRSKANKHYLHYSNEILVRIVRNVCTNIRLRTVFVGVYTRLHVRTDRYISIYDWVLQCFYKISNCNLNVGLISRHDRKSLVTCRTKNGGSLDGLNKSMFNYLQTNKPVHQLTS